MINVIVLGPIEVENVRKMLAADILANRTGISYFRLMEQLSEGGFDYFHIVPDKKNIKLELENAINYLNKLGVKYKIVKKELSDDSQNARENREDEQQPPAATIPTDKNDVSQEASFYEYPKREEKDEHPPITATIPTYDNSHEIGSYSEHEQNKDAHPPITTTTPAHDGSHAPSFTTTSLSSIEDPIDVDPPKKNNTLKIILGILAFAALVVLMSYINKARTTGNRFPTRTRQIPQTQEDALSDADNACIEGSIDTEKMYRIAISMNKNNLGAWSGLLKCFEKKGDGKKIIEIRGEMLELFGDYVFSILRIIEPYGTPENFSPQNRICKITYLRSDKSDDADGELFAVSSAISNISGFDSAVIFAKNSVNSGFMVSIRFAEFPQNVEDFMQRITVNKVGH